jgi:hypothetical protein
VIDTDAWLEVWGSPTAGPIIEICDPEVEVHAVTLGIEGRHYTGHEGVRQWMRDVRDRFHARSEPKSIEVLSDDVVLMSGVLFMQNDLGGEDQQKFGMVIHLRDDKARWIGTFFTPEEAKTAWHAGVTGPRPG